MKKKQNNWKSFRINKEDFDKLVEISEFQRRKKVKVISIFLNDYYKENEKKIKDFLETA